MVNPKAMRLLCGLLLCASVAGAGSRDDLELIRRAAENASSTNPALIARWKEGVKSNLLWGYDAPANPVYLAATLAYLYEETGEKEYARRAATLLSTYGDLRDALPAGFAGTRAEYGNGVPPLSNFFFMPPYVRAYLRIRESGVLSAEQKQKIETEVAQSVDFIFRFPEWGAHNRAMLRAEALQYAILAMPDHPRAAAWKQLAAAIAADNLNHWEVEDASNYHPVYLHALLSYAEAAGRTDIFSHPVLHYYALYYLKQISPAGTLPDYGDANWNTASSGLRLMAFFERMASVLKDPQLKWAARTIRDGVVARAPVLGVGDAYHLADAIRWSDTTLVPVRPSSGSEEVLEDVIGKKVVFRNGWEPASTYCMLNYRDEGDGGWLDRENLRRSISVEEEKMHHGHADENSIVLLMDGGSVLLHDAGYRDALPSGPYGSWRQDYYHNRLVVRKNKKDPREPVLDFVRNSGAYRPVQTRKIDYLSLRDADVSRTRVIDATLGYEWDRTIVYVREPGYFVVVDGVKILTSDYYTFANLWHTQTVIRKGDNYVAVANDSIGPWKLPPDRGLLIVFPETYQKSLTIEPISRHFQTEQAICQTVASQYRAGSMECFVTVLAPFKRGEDPAPLAARFRLLPTSVPYRAMALERIAGTDTTVLMVNCDLEREVARENIRPRALYDLGKASFGGFETDAHFFFATKTPHAVDYSAATFLKVRYGGKTLVEALPNTHPLQLDGGGDRVGYTKWRRWEGKVDR